MEIALVAVVGTLCIACFLFGAKIGQTVSRGQEIKTPSLNPMKAVREKQDRKAAEEEQNKIDTILRNIETYDGTDRGQEDVPR